MTCVTNVICFSDSISYFTCFQIMRNQDNTGNDSCLTNNDDRKYS